MSAITTSRFKNVVFGENVFILDYKSQFNSSNNIITEVNIIVGQFQGIKEDTVIIKVGCSIIEVDSKSTIIGNELSSNLSKLLNLNTLIENKAQ
jgi:hypothetical protein